MPRLTIRRALSEEAVMLSSVAFAAKRYWGYSEQQMHAWRADLEITAATVSNRPVFVAEYGGQVAGFYSLLELPHEWELDHLWVLPEFNRQGIGRALLEHAGVAAASRGARAIAIDADPNAEAFYLACGAQRAGAVAAPIPGHPDRVRPQMVLPVSQL